MIERAFDKARQHTKELLAAAGVVALAIKDQVVATRFQRAVEQEQPFFEIPEDLGIRFTRKIGCKSVGQLEIEAKSVRNVSGPALDMMHNPKFITFKEVTPQKLIALRVQDLGLPGTSTTKQIIARATHSIIRNTALELCRSEVGPHQAIADKDQPLDDYYYIILCMNHLLTATAIRLCSR